MTCLSRSALFLPLAHNFCLRHGICFGKASKLPSHCLTFLSFSLTEDLLPLEAAHAMNVLIPGQYVFVILTSSPEARLPPAPLPAFLAVLGSDSMSAEPKAAGKLYEGLIPFKETLHLDV